MSADGRFVPARLCAFGAARTGGFAADANARSIASCAALRLPAMCSCISRSMRSPRSTLVLVMRGHSHDRDHALNSTPERLPYCLQRHRRDACNDRDYGKGIDLSLVATRLA